MNVTNKNIINLHGTIDVKAAKTVFNLAHNFITNLYKILPLPSTEIDEDDDADMSVALASKKHIKMKRFGKGTRAKSLDELHSKLEAIKGKRKTYKEKLESKGLKNRLSKKKKNEVKRLKKNLIKKMRPVSEIDVKPMIIPPKPSKPMYNSEGKMVFSKFEFEEPGNMPQKTLSADPKALLKKLQKQQEKIKNLEMTGNIERVKIVKESLAWKTVLEKAEGKKMKDDPALLMKSIKRRTDRKQRSKKKWTEREEFKKKELNKKQKKRAENIDSRKKQVKKNKVKKFVKKGRIVL